MTDFAYEGLIIIFVDGLLRSFFPRACYSLCALVLSISLALSFHHHNIACIQFGQTKQMCLFSALSTLQLNVTFKKFVLLLHVKEVCGSDLVQEAI